MVATYSLVGYCNSSIRFVALPVHNIITPVANGSRVPACPTLSFFTPIFLQIEYLTLLTTANDVHFSGLLKYKISPSLKFIKSFYIEQITVILPMIAQYIAKYTNCPFFTMLS